MDKIKLKPCPFCGGVSSIRVSGPYTTGHGESSDDVIAQCESCGAKIVLSHYTGYQLPERVKSCIEKWNHRV